MDTVDNAVEYLQLHQTPYWTIQSGSTKVGESTGTDNMEDSISRFRQSMQLLPNGSYKLLCTKNVKDNRGGLTCPFTKGQTTGQPATTMQPALPSSNAYGIPDHVFNQIVQKAQQDFMFQQMHGEFTAFMKDWPELKKKIERIEKIEAFLKNDEDGDGTPDFMEMTKKASDTVKAASEMKKVFEGGKLFG